MTDGDAIPVTVVGVGGAGVNAIQRLLDVDQPGVRYLAVDTSAQSLASVPAAVRLAIGVDERRLGAGGDPQLGRAAALAHAGRISEALAGSQVVLVVAGMGGGTGGGAGPEVARLARSLGAATVAFGLMPFAWEGRKRQALAQAAAKRLQVMSDTFVAVANDRTVALTGRLVPLDIALRIGDDSIRQAVQGLAEMLSGRAWIPVDRAALQAHLSDGGQGCIAVGIGRGADAGRRAVDAVLNSPLVEPTAWRQARAAIVRVSGGPELTVTAVADMVDRLRRAVAADCELVVGAGLDPALRQAVQLTVIVTQIAAQPVRTSLAGVLAAARSAEQVMTLATAPLVG